jgi:hypothetical protein
LSGAGLVARPVKAERQRLMLSPAYELAVIGSTPLAGLLAGLLAAEHGKRVVLVSEGSSLFRLVQGIDLAAAITTRPESWARLIAGSIETRKLVRRIAGRGALQRIDPVFVGETAASRTALSHMRHVALGFGLAVERREGLAGGESATFRLRDVALIDRQRLAEGLAKWHAKAGVLRLDAGGTNAVISRDGSARFHANGQVIEAAHAILADDAAIAAQMEEAGDDPVLELLPTSAMATEPARRLAAPALSYPDRGVTLLRREGGSLLALATGRAETAAARVGSCLTGQRPLKRVGQRLFRAVVSRDGAPLVEIRPGERVSVMAGFGPPAAFFAPALARLVVGAASIEETAYFMARRADADRRQVADYVPCPAAEEAA